jgi:hypothetical protein
MSGIDLRLVLRARAPNLPLVYVCEFLVQPVLCFSSTSTVRSGRTEYKYEVRFLWGCDPPRPRPLSPVSLGARGWIRRSVAS